jgi:hypothetical protein
MQSRQRSTSDSAQGIMRYAGAGYDEAKGNRHVALRQRRAERG